MSQKSICVKWAILAQCWPNILTSQDMLYGFFIKCCIMIGDNNLTKVTFVKFPTKIVFLALLVISAWLWLKAFIKNLLKGFLSNLLEDKKCIKSLKRSLPKKILCWTNWVILLYYWVIWPSLVSKLYKLLSQDWCQGFSQILHHNRAQ